MKKILLSSAAIVAFAGAASAEITWTGNGTLGYNDDYEDGVYVDVDVDISASAELNNGWVATMTYGLELDDNGEDFTDADFSADDNLTLSLSNDMMALTYGDTEYAAVSYWNGVSDMANDGFSEVDGEAVLKLTGTIGSIEAGLSGGIYERNVGAIDGGEVYQLGFGMTTTVGMVDLSVAYQEEDTDAGTFIPSNAGYGNGDFNGNEIFGLSAGFALGGADLLVAYASDETAGEDSLGLSVAYPVGAYTLGAYYVAESLGDDTYGVSVDYADGPIVARAYWKTIQGSDEYGIGAGYDLGTGLVVSAGYIDGDSLTDDDFAGYIVADYDLGGGASFIASFADYTGDAAADIITDDIDTVTGGYELLSGTTLALSLAF
ncbi:porin [Celeribacter litoreus]|uniref:porin n=1 Tax=Celeribacter litoreus TaxID=2876714 RepID=UPI001CCF6DA3|nr:porin [Celeribacter litoreus]MCA0041926.1 porin [Celeribacter litoreus]